MSVILKRIVDAYNYLDDDLSDPRTKHLLVVKPYFVFTVYILYYKFVTDWGPKFMKNREPLKIDNIIKVYNVIQIVCCSIIVYKSIVEIWIPGRHSLICEPLDYGTTPFLMDILKYVTFYYYLKILDLMDTVFFVLRKKQSQITFLHVYHHMIMILSGFLGVKYIAGGHSTILGSINSFVHAIMYTYYLLTIINPEYKKSIWWKKHLTQLQLCQFAFLLIHFTHPLFQPNCTYPKWISLIFLPQNIFMTFMFGDFYYKEYIKKKQ